MAINEVNKSEMTIHMKLEKQAYGHEKHMWNVCSCSSRSMLTVHQYVPIDPPQPWKALQDRVHKANMDNFNGSYRSKLFEFEPLFNLDEVDDEYMSTFSPPKHHYHHLKTQLVSTPVRQAKPRTVPSIGSSEASSRFTDVFSDISDAETHMSLLLSEGK